MLLATTLALLSLSSPPGDLDMGRRVYRKACLTCHGKTGRGDGPGAPGIFPKPRDFTTAEFRFKSTPSGELATDNDLRRTIEEGISGGEMPAWGALLSDDEITHVIAYIKSFCDEFCENTSWNPDPQEPLPEEPEPIFIPPPIISTPSSIERGRLVFDENGCSSCHGAKGDLVGIETTLRTSNHEIIEARDLTRHPYKRGLDPRQIYLTLRTGLSGPPLPEYSIISEKETYHLINYLVSIREKRGFVSWLLDDSTFQSTRCD